MLTSIRNVKFYKNALEYNVYHRCLCYFLNQITMFDNDKNKYVSLERKEFVKYLGIFIDQSLTRKHHIDHVAFKISRYVGSLSKLRHHVPTHTLITIYRSLISPHLTYGLLAWGQACKSHLEKLL